MVKFPHMSLSCEDALNVALSPLAKSVGTEFNCGFPQAMPRKLTSTVFQKKGRAVTHLAEKLMFDRGPRYAGSNIYKYVDMLKVAGGTETSAAKIAERFFEDDKELMMRDYVLTCSTVPGKIGVFGICEDCPAGKFSTGDSNVCKDCRQREWGRLGRSKVFWQQEYCGEEHRSPETWHVQSFVGP